MKQEFPSLTRRRRPALSTGRELNRLMICNDVSKSSTFSQAEWKITALYCIIWRHLRTRDAFTSYLIVQAIRFPINVKFWSTKMHWVPHVDAVVFPLLPLLTQSHFMVAAMNKLCFTESLSPPCLVWSLHCDVFAFSVIIWVVTYKFSCFWMILPCGLYLLEEKVNWWTCHRLI